MNFSLIKLPSLIAGIAMIVAAGLAVAITPTHHLADQGPKVNLESMIPKQFGDWVVDDQVTYQQVNPEVKAALDKIYSQLLTRTYVNSHGYRVMLTIPYGVDQSDGLSAHDPEGCYPAQGFQIMAKSKAILHTAVGDVPVRRMEASNGPRYEPVTYWFTVGHFAVNNDWDRKRAKLNYAIKGEIPDGVLFRASSIDSDVHQAYLAQGAFIEALLMALTPESRALVAGLTH